MAEKHLPPAPDEAYWAGLFAQEAMLSPDKSIEARDWQSADEGVLGGFFTQRPGGNPAAWVRAREARAADQVVEAIVVGYNAGGVLVLWEGLQGFVPASQLADLLDLHIEEARRQALQSQLHRTLSLKIIELDEGANRFVLSERAVDVAAEEKRRLLYGLRPGDKLAGHVTNLTEFGAFVDLGGVEGLVHISELSWNRVDHPSSVVQPGQPVTVQVLSVQPERERIGLSIKRLRTNPWASVNMRYHPGQLVTGTVTNVVSYGAFVRLEDELEGLVHISELAQGVVMHPQNVVRRGDTVTARVLEVNGEARRLALSMRQAQEV